jgi:hypothetical protein
MPKCLTPAQIEQYREDGRVFPIRIMSETEPAELRGRLEAFERRTGGPLKGDMRHKPHLLFAWLAELVRCRSILDAVEDLHGPDLLCRTTNSTAWVAFTEATEANGAVEYIPGGHKLDQIPHRDTFAKHDLLTRGQEVMVEVDHSRRRIITLRPGEMSLHHVRPVYGSPPNPSDDRRIGFAIRYIPAGVVQLAGEHSATLVDGEGRHHHFMAEPQPSHDLDPEFVALHRAITECGARILYRGTDVASYNEPKALAQRG